MKPNKLTRAGILASAIIGILLTIIYPSVIDLWYVIGSVCIPGLLIPVLESTFAYSVKNSFLCSCSRFLPYFIRLDAGRNIYPTGGQGYLFTWELSRFTRPGSCIILLVGPEGKNSINNNPD